MNKNTRNDEEGAVLVIVALCLVVFLGIAAFTVDVGYLQYQRRHLQNTADAAALAGAREYIDGDSSQLNIKSVIKSVVDNYVELNQVDVGEVDNVILDKVDSTEFNTVKVDLKGNRKIFFANIFGIKNSDIVVTATAIASSGSIDDLFPLLPFYYPENFISDLESQGKLFRKFDDADPDNPFAPGHWGSTSFFENGNNKIKDWIEQGYYDGDPIKIGDEINTKSGAGLNAVRDDLKKLEGHNFAIAVVEDVFKKNGKVDDSIKKVKRFIGVKFTKTDGQGAGLYINVEVLKVISIDQIIYKQAAAPQALSLIK
ncbi:MAG: pilus assembly protein TadG-related protein [Desulfobacterium sp.]|nr:pilus assembly protein TadG-related protein [Desulfobacterium sp.]